MTPVTIRDVARRAKVGIGTVSRVINENPAVSPATRQRVLEAIEELDYVPNLAARRLSRGRTHSISVILPYLTIPSFVERLRGVQNILEYSEYDLVLYSAENPDRRDHLLQSLPRQARTDGIIIISICPNRKLAEQLKKSNIPIVLVDAMHKDFPSVYVNNVEGGFMATKHLISLGHKKIAFISDYLVNDFHFSAMQERFEGYKQALEMAKIPFNPDYHIEVPHNREQAKEAALSLLRMDDPPSAIFASSDIQGVGVLQAAGELSLNVPQQLSVIGFDGIRDSEYANLTTVKQPLFTSGVEGTKLLLGIIEGNMPKSASLQLGLELISRNTTSVYNNSN